MYIYIYKFIYIRLFILFGVRIAFIKGSLDESSWRFIWKFSSNFVNVYFVCTNKRAVLKGIYHILFAGIHAGDFTYTLFQISFRLAGYLLDETNMMDMEKISMTDFPIDSSENWKRKVSDRYLMCLCLL